MNTSLYDSRDPRCKSPFGAVPTGQTVTFRLFLPIPQLLRDPNLLLYKADHWENPQRIALTFETSDGVCNYYVCTFCADQPQLYFYLFEVTGVNGLTKISRNGDGFGMLSAQSAEMWQLTVYDQAMKTPDFLKTGIMYQIFPDRFCNSGTPKADIPADRRLHSDWFELPEYLPDQNGEVTNSDYFGGDLAGITSKLSYLKGLGVTSIYLNPVFEAHSNHRYNTADYMKIDPLLGNEEDFKTLCDRAHELDMHIILDGVFNHTGSDSVYFNKKRRYGDGGAFNDPNSPYRTWYDFSKYPNEYHSWWGFLELPNLNEKDPGYSAFICGEDGVLKKWLKLGISGFRLDVADELPDEFLDQICTCIKDYDPQAAVIGEVWEDASTKFAYGVRRRYFLGKQLDSVMNYPFKDAILAYIRYGDCTRLYSTILSILEHYPKPVLDVLMTSLSTHDVERAITALAGEPTGNNGRDWQGQNNTISPARYDLGKKLFRLASVIQYMLPGIPCLYYGDEAGLYGYKDPFNRTCYPWGHEDHEMLSLFRALGQLRTDFPALSSGSFSAVSFTHDVVSFVRDCGETSLYVAVNRTEHPAQTLIPKEFAGAKTIYGLFDGSMLAPYDCVILAK